MQTQVKQKILFLLIDFLFHTIIGNHQSSPCRKSASNQLPFPSTLFLPFPRGLYSSLIHTPPPSPNTSFSLSYGWPSYLSHPPTSLSSIHITHPTSAILHSTFYEYITHLFSLYPFYTPHRPLPLPLIPPRELPLPPSPHSSPFLVYTAPSQPPTLPTSSLLCTHF